MLHCIFMESSQECKTLIGKIIERNTVCWGPDDQGPFFMRNSQVFHENIVSKRYTKDMETAHQTKQTRL